MTKRGLAIILIISASAFFVGCNQSQKNIYLQKQVGLECVQGEINLGKLLNNLSNKSFYKYKLISNNKEEDINIEFSSVHCIDNIVDFQRLVAKKTDVNAFVSPLSGEGLVINNLKISQAIDYLSKRSEANARYVGFDIILKDSSFYKIKSISSLEKYIKETTPFYLTKEIDKNTEIVLYKLEFKTFYANNANKNEKNEKKELLFYLAEIEKLLKDEDKKRIKRIYNKLLNI